MKRKTFTSFSLKERTNNPSYNTQLKMKRKAKKLKMIPHFSDFDVLAEKSIAPFQELARFCEERILSNFASLLVRGDHQMVVDD